MPELPEVRTICDILRKKVLNHTIEKVIVSWPKVIKHPEVELFQTKLQNETIKNIHQKGKNILLLCDNYCLISHLRMEGKYFYLPNTEAITTNMLRHALVMFVFTNQSVLLYHDTRRFGTMHLYDVEQYQDAPVLLRVGPEPFADEVTGAYLYQHYQKRKMAIKTVLLEQKVMAGLGNIYANEVLFATKINPYMKANKLTKEQCQSIVTAARRILNEAIAQGGTTVSSYHPDVGVDGKFQNALQVHGRKNQPCKICTGLIRKEYLNQRGLYYCPTCQPALN